MTTPQSEQNINEASECFVNVSFFDQNGNPYTPTALQYRIDCLDDNTQVLGWTTITPTGTSQTVTITATQNAMVDIKRKSERRQVSFHVTPPGSTGRYDRTTYTLINIVGVP